MQKKIVINALCVGKRFSGLGRVGVEVINEIFKRGIEDQFIIIVNRGALHHLRELDVSKFVVVNKFCSSDYGVFGHALRIVYSNIITLKYFGHKVWALSQIEASLFGQSQYLIVHDVIPLIMSKQSPKLFYYFKYYLKLALSNTKMVFTDSEYSKKRIEEFYSGLLSPVKVIYLGVPSVMNEKIQIKDNIILYTGRYSPTKNVEGLLRAFTQYRDRGGLLKLSFCGVSFCEIELETQGELRKLVEDDCIFFHGYVSDEILRQQYLRSKGLVLPSFEEGFGLTVLEGVANGCVVACSNRSSIPEVGGDLAFYFDPSSRDEMVASLFEIEKSQKCYDQEYLQQCEKHLRKFNWEDALTNYLELIKNDVY